MTSTFAFNGFNYTSLSSADGWLPASGTWSYTSADDPVFVASVPDIDAANMTIGDRWKVTQTTVKYFIVVAKGSPSGGFTPVTIYGGTDYDLANAAITSPYYSHANSPLGFPMDRTKWDLEWTDANNKQKTTPAQNTWYGGANAWSTGTGISADVPIGCWNLSYSVYQMVLDTSATVVTMETTLSTSNNSESDEAMTASIGGNGASGTITVRQTSYVEKVYTLASKTTHYLLARTETANIDEIDLLGGTRKTIIRARFLYL